MAAGLVSALFGGLILLRKERQVASWNFLGGMLLLSGQSFLDGFVLGSVDVVEAARWQRAALIVSIPMPAIWLAFSLTYSRGNAWAFLRKWRYVLAIALLLPIGIATWTGLAIEVRSAHSGGGWWLPFSRDLGALNLLHLAIYALVLSNLEKTLRAAAGTVQWRIKFAVLGLGVIFAARIYTATQGLLYSGQSSDLMVVEALAIILGCGLLAVAYARRGFADLDVYPSRAVLQSSLTVLLVGGYLVVVGLLAQALAFLGDTSAFRAQAFLILLATVLLGAILLSDRLRLRIRQAITRHFHRPVHDYRAVWASLTKCLSSAFDQRQLSQGLSRLLAGTFEVLSVNVWIADSTRGILALGASTSGEANVGQDDEKPTRPIPQCDEVKTSRPVFLDQSAPAWVRGLDSLGASQFPNGGGRVCLPLVAAGEMMGVVILADRVDGQSYELDELDLLQCIGDQAAAAILRMRMTAELMQAKELEAFQTLSAFFVHD